MKNMALWFLQCCLPADSVTSEGRQDNVGQESARIHACLLVYDETWRKEIYQFENNKISLNHMHAINSKMSETVKGVESPGSWSAATEFVAGIDPSSLARLCPSAVGLV
jgi:hypothetical protein